MKIKLPLSDSFRKAQGFRKKFIRDGFIMCESRADILCLMKQYPSARTDEWTALEAYAKSGELTHRHACMIGINAKQ